MVTTFLENLWQLTNAMALYILFGLLIAGILHEVLPQDFITKHLGKKSFASNLKATLFGIPMPVCSCGVIPLAQAIRKQGASKGATLSFLIATPITGVDSILATYGILGLLFTIYRIITSTILAIIAGILANLFEKEATKSFTQTKPTFTLNKSPLLMQNTSKKNRKKFSFKNAIKYGFVTLLGDIAKPLIIGLLLGALITTALPKDLSNLLSSNIALSYIIALAIALPMYVCATASLPIAASLVLSGITPGAAFVFLSAGPATNTVTMSVVKKMLGNKALFIYLGVLIVGSVGFGVLLDIFFDQLTINPNSIVHMQDDYSLPFQISAFLLWVFLLYFYLKPYFQRKSCCSGGSCCSS